MHHLGRCSNLSYSNNRYQRENFPIDRDCILQEVGAKMNWFKLFFLNKRSVPELTTTILYNQDTFYKKFTQDLLKAKYEVIIESPFITSSRMLILLPIFQKLIQKKIKVHLVTKDPAEYNDEHFKHQATNEILSCADIGIRVSFIKNMKNS